MAMGRALASPDVVSVTVSITTDWIQLAEAAVTYLLSRRFPGCRANDVAFRVLGGNGALMTAERAVRAPWLLRAFPMVGVSIVRGIAREPWWPTHTAAASEAAPAALASTAHGTISPETAPPTSALMSGVSPAAASSSRGAADAAAAAAGLSDPARAAQMPLYAPAHGAPAWVRAPPPPASTMHAAMGAGYVAGTAAIAGPPSAPHSGVPEVVGRALGGAYVLHRAGPSAPMPTHASGALSPADLGVLLLGPPASAGATDTANFDC